MYNIHLNKLCGRKAYWIQKVSLIIFCLHGPGFQRQVFKQVKSLSERSKRMKEQKMNKASVLVANTTYNSQSSQFGLVITIFLLSFEKPVFDR